MPARARAAPPKALPRRASKLDHQPPCCAGFAATLRAVSSLWRASSSPSVGLLWLLSAGLLPACGARTGIELDESCAPLGVTRACQGVCGVGVQTCAGGSWGECQVPKVESPCSGLCGSGVRTCSNGVLGACVIPVARRSCSNECGAGEQSCEQEAWQTCVVPVALRDCMSVCGSGHESCTGGKWGACDAPLPKPPVLHTTIRDFHKTQADFETRGAGNAIDPGMVEVQIGADRTPVYAGHPTTPSTPSGKAGFDVWYHDTPGVNLTTPYDLQLSVDPRTTGGFFYESRAFFPIDDQLFGNEGYFHNFHFTLETHTQFVYRGGEVFTFAGDDDVWVFIADQLVIDLGGLHTIRTGSVSLDTQKTKLNLMVGQRYPLDLFFAERHTFSSNFIVHTTIADVGSCD